MHVHVEVQPDPEIAGHERRKGGVVPGVRQHAVDVRRFEPRIIEGIIDRPGSQVAGGFLGPAAVGRLPHPHDGVFVPQVLRGGGVYITLSHRSLLAVLSVVAWERLRA